MNRMLPYRNAIISALTTCICLFLTVGLRGATPSTSRRQRAYIAFESDGHFGGCDAWAEPVTQGVAAAILATAQGKDGAERANASQLSHPEVLFKARKIQVGGSDDLLICGSGPMTGADNDWVWIVTNADRAPRAIFEGGGLGIELRSARHHGYRDVEIEWNSACCGYTQAYHYNGSRYRPMKRHSFEMKP